MTEVLNICVGVRILGKIGNRKLEIIVYIIVRGTDRHTQSWHIRLLIDTFSWMRK